MPYNPSFYGIFSGHIFANVGGGDYRNSFFSGLFLQESCGLRDAGFSERWMCAPYSCGWGPKLTTPRTSYRWEIGPKLKWPNKWPAAPRRGGSQNGRKMAGQVESKFAWPFFRPFPARGCWPFFSAIFSFGPISCL